MLLKVGFICVHHAVEPWQQLLCAVIGMEDNWDFIGGGNGTDVLSCGDGAGDRSFLVLVSNTLGLSVSIQHDSGCY